MFGRHIGMEMFGRLWGETYKVCGDVWETLGRLRTCVERFGRPLERQTECVEMFWRHWRDAQKVCRDV